MEFLPGDLTSILTTPIPDGDRQEEQLIKIIYRCICAMDFMHSANVMHRDIKPPNILISEEDEIKICDFGLSRKYYTSDNISENCLTINNPKDNIDSKQWH